jgi:hypothetical protein
LNVLTGTMVLVLVLQLFAFIQQSKSLKGTVRAASEANTLTREMFRATERPWVSLVDASVLGNLVLNPKGARFTLRFIMRNVGRLPAFRVRVRAHAYIDGPAYTKRGQQDQLAQQVRKPSLLDPTINDRDVLFPQEEYLTDYSLTVPDDGQPHASPPGHISPVVVGVVDYKLSPDETSRQTGFVFSLYRIDPTSQGSGRCSFELGDSTVPFSELLLQRDPIGGRPAAD